MSSGNISEWPFELLELVFRQISVEDLCALTRTCQRLRDTALSVLLIRNDAQYSTLANKLYSSTLDDHLSLRLPEQHIDIVLYALHIAPSSFYAAFKTLSLSCAFPHPPYPHYMNDVLRKMRRLMGVFGRVRQLGRISLDFTSVARWWWNPRFLGKEQADEFRQVCRDLLTQVVNKGCWTLQVELKHAGVPYPAPDTLAQPKTWGWKARTSMTKLTDKVHIPQSLRIKFPSRSKRLSRSCQLQSNLTSIVATTGMLSDPFFRTTLYKIIHASKQLTSLALQFPELGACHHTFQRDALAQLQIPSLRSYTVQSTSHVDLSGHEAFLKRHPTLTSLDFPHSFRYFLTPSREFKPGSLGGQGWTLVLPYLERLTCDAEVLHYFLKNMEKAFPVLKEVMIVWFSGFSRAEQRLNETLAPLEDKLCRIPSLGLRVGFTTPQFEVEGLADPDKSFIRNRVVKLDLHFLGGVPIIRSSTVTKLHKWMQFPNVKYLVFSSINRHARTAAGESVVQRLAERRFWRWSLEEDILRCLATSYSDRISKVWFEDEVFEVDLVKEDLAK